MSVESSFFKDRPANREEIPDLRFDEPTVQSISRHEDIYLVHAVDPGAEKKTIETGSGEEIEGVDVDVWALRMS